MHRTPVLAALAVLTHVAFVAAYGSTLGDVLGVLFLVLIAALLLPPLVRAAWRLRHRA
jgi:Flp pilus assembly protein TadB